jgi:precorrin-2 dehydrogenase/sirohydrochlorin ferrochelatase
MPSFPVNLRLAGKQAVIVGGGRVAARKCQALLDAGAAVRVVAPRLTRELSACVRAGAVTHVPRHFETADLDGAFLVFAATSDRNVNRAVAAEAAARGVLVNVADAPELCDFTVPASLRQGDLLVTVSTGGRSPALARAIRRQLETAFGPDYALTLHLLGALREKLLTVPGKSAYNSKILNDLVALDLPALFRYGATAEIDHHLLRLFGPGFTLAELGVRERDPQ